jgi:hypothetical protein
MTFGVIKSLIEDNLIESYKNEREFKKTLREFKENILNNQKLSKIYSIYEQIYTPQSLSEKDANEFINEGIFLIRNLLKNVKLPTSINETKNNSYDELDTLVYSNVYELNKRVEARKKLVSILTSNTTQVKESINLPVQTMVKIANQTLENYIQNMDEDSKKVFFDIVKKDSEVLKNDFVSLKESTLNKLNSILESQSTDEIKNKIDETIKSVQTDEFSQVNYLRLVFLEKNL